MILRVLILMLSDVQELMANPSSGSSVSQILRKLILETGDLARYLSYPLSESLSLNISELT